MNRRLNQWVDCVVRANDGDVGTVAQFYFDDLTWMIRYLVVNTGAPPSGRHVLIAPAAFGKPDWEEPVLPVNLTLAQVHSSPITDIVQPVSRRHEAALHEHFAWPTYWDGGFYVPLGYGLATAPPDGAATPLELLSSGVRRVDPHLRRTRDVMGSVVQATDGSIGHVEDFLVDDATWGIRYLVVNTRNWLPDRRVLVSPQWIGRMGWNEKEVFVDLSQDAVKRSPAFDPAKPVTPDDEDNLHGHLQKAPVLEWVLFKFNAPPGTKIHVAGTFNNWHPTAIPLGVNRQGTYTAMVLLPVGCYEYKFIVNGVWCNGPGGCEQVPNAFGTKNNVLRVERSTTPSGHLHTFARPRVSPDHLLWSTPRGG